MSEQYHRDLANLAMYGKEEAQNAFKDMTGMDITEEDLDSIYQLQWAMLNSMWYVEDGFPVTQENSYNYPCDAKYLLTNNKKWD